MTDTIYHIYKHTSKTSGKSYIGVTNNLKRRLNGHRCDANNGSKYPFHKAWRQYGEQDWITEILYSTKSEEHVYSQEVYFIAEYNTYIDGYNGTPGGILPPPMSGDKHWLYGKTHSNETKIKLSENHADCTGSKNSRAKHIWLRSPDGTLYKTFGSFEIFCITHSLSYCTATRQLRKNIKPTFGSFYGWEIWYPTEKEIDEERIQNKDSEIYGNFSATEYKEILSNVINLRSKKVHIKGKNFNFIKAAAKYYNRAPGTIYSWLKNKDDCWYV